MALLSHHLLWEKDTSTVKSLDSDSGNKKIAPIKIVRHVYNGPITMLRTNTRINDC